ncbi:MAG: hypothetical protein EXR21_03435 [Flavobacteriaceae bacterium]|nr:hypothetical protein [Flavobacteriaceae bacterium]
MKESPNLVTETEGLQLQMVDSRASANLEHMVNLPRTLTPRQIEGIHVLGQQAVDMLEMQRQVMLMAKRIGLTIFN